MPCKSPTGPDPTRPQFVAWSHFWGKAQKLFNLQGERLNLPRSLSICHNCILFSFQPGFRCLPVERSRTHHPVCNLYHAPRLLISAPLGPTSPTVSTVYTCTGPRPAARLRLRPRRRSECASPATQRVADVTESPRLSQHLAPGRPGQPHGTSLLLG